MIDYIRAIRLESARFAELVAAADKDTPVPSCPEWSVADLTWHLLEVQHFWASIVADLLQSPENVDRIDRPRDGDLVNTFREQTVRLVSALAARASGDECWSWHAGGRSVGWVRRRQAHEALIHRVDAELATGGPFSVDEKLAADGVDEILRVMVDATHLPDSATYLTDGTMAVVAINDGALSWAMTLGRFTGASPVSGNVYDDPALRLVNDAADPSATLRGSAVDLDLWLWGRGSIDGIRIDGDPTVADHIRAAAIVGTQ